MIQDRIDFLVRRRAGWASGLGMGLLGTLALSVTGIDSGAAGSIIQLCAWVLWTTLVILFLATSGAWWRAAPVRSIMNDETTKGHMQRGFVTGFWCS